MLMLILLSLSTGWKTAIMIALLILVFWLFLIRPQNQQAKKESAYRHALKNGDRVMTAGGIHVTVRHIDRNMATVELSKGTDIHVQLATLQPIPEPKKKKNKKDK